MKIVQINNKSIEKAFSFIKNVRDVRELLCQPRKKGFKCIQLTRLLIVLDFRFFHRF